MTTTEPSTGPSRAPGLPPPRTEGPVLVVGTGLVGTSVGLALRARGVDVQLRDASPTALAVARDRGAGAAQTASPVTPRLVVVAVPPDVTAAEVAGAARRHPDAVLTDVASVKEPVVATVAQALDGGATARFVGGHPMAGRERSGPLAARPDLFEARPWVLTPVASTDPAALGSVRDLVADLGAVPVEMSPEAHDEAVALVSHLPQLAASLVAARLRDAAEEAVELAGPGLRDVTRIAASDPMLWAQILGANAGPVRRVLAEVRRDLDDVLAALGTLAADTGPAGGHGARAVLAGVVGDGNEGRDRIPGKHGGGPVAYSVVGVLVPDRPGEVARLLAEVGRVGVNLEDIRIEHSLGRPTGLVEVSVTPGSREVLARHLSDRGWTVAT